MEHDGKRGAASHSHPITHNGEKLETDCPMRPLLYHMAYMVIDLYYMFICLLPYSEILLATWAPSSTNRRPRVGLRQMGKMGIRGSKSQHPRDMGSENTIR